jgi:hypothetical protein
MSANPVMVLQGASAIMKMQAAQTQAKGLAAQASYAQLQAKSEMLKYKQQGVAVLRNLVRTQASINAGAGARGFDATSGTPLGLSRYAASEAANEYFLTREGQTIALRTGEIRADQYMKQASAVKQQAFMSAAFGLGSQAYSQGLLGEAPQQSFEIYNYGI